MPLSNSHAATGKGKELGRSCVHSHMLALRSSLLSPASSPIHTWFQLSFIPTVPLLGSPICACKRNSSEQRLTHKTMQNFLGIM